jgi:hypothetical protein
MTSKVTALLIVIALGRGASAFAQEVEQPQAVVEVIIIPGGATIFQQGDETGEPAFTNFGVGGAVTFNFRRHFAAEAEVLTSLGIPQNLEFATFQQDTRTPNILQYTGNLMVYVPTRSAVVPFVIGGVGALTMFERETLVIPETRTFLAGNVGGGAKWYAGRWGVRADYRFLVVRDREPDPLGPGVRPRAEFFGKEMRYGHRVYGALVLNVG